MKAESSALREEVREYGQSLGAEFMRRYPSATPELIAMAHRLLRTNAFSLKDGPINLRALYLEAARRLGWFDRKLLSAEEAGVQPAAAQREAGTPLTPDAAPPGLGPMV